MVRITALAGGKGAEETWISPIILELTLQDTKELYYQLFSEYINRGQTHGNLDRPGKSASSRVGPGTHRSAASSLLFFKRGGDYRQDRPGKLFYSVNLLANFDLGCTYGD
jgi:hypothetical protein